MEEKQSKKEKIEMNAEINKQPFKWILIKDKTTQKIISSMDKPKLQFIDPNIHVSGCHIFQDNPEQNHYDHYHKGKEWKERGTKKKKLKYSLSLEEDKVIFNN